MENVSIWILFCKFVDISDEILHVFNKNVDDVSCFLNKIYDIDLKY